MPRGASLSAQHCELWVSLLRKISVVTIDCSIGIAGISWPVLKYSCFYRGKKISVKGWFKDPIQSNNGKVVTSTGLRWMPVMLLTSVPFVGRIFALSFLTFLVPSEKKHKALGKRHRSPQRRASQVVCLLRLVVDAGYACIELARQCDRT